MVGQNLTKRGELPDRLPRKAALSSRGFVRFVGPAIGLAYSAEAELCAIAAIADEWAGWRGQRETL